MRERTRHSADIFDEWVICEIELKPKQELWSKWIYNWGVDVNSMFPGTHVCQHGKFKQWNTGVSWRPTNTPHTRPIPHPYLLNSNISFLQIPRVVAYLTLKLSDITTWAFSCLWAFSCPWAYPSVSVAKMTKMWHKYKPRLYLYVLQTELLHPQVRYPSLHISCPRGIFMS